MIVRLLLSIALMGVVTPAFAKGDCTDAKDIVNMAQSIYRADAALTDIISPSAQLQLKALNGAPEPSGLLYKYEAEEVRLLLDADGYVQNLERAADFNKDGELCKLSNGVVPEDTGEDTTQANMNFVFAYKPKNGVYDIEYLREGAKDGSKIMKSLAPSGLGFVVPGLKSLMIKPMEETSAVPTISWQDKQGNPVAGPAMTQINTTQLIRLKDLKKSRAETLIITGDYSLGATFKFDPEEIEKAEAERLAISTSETSLKTEN